jgi:predicted amidohydrolase
MAEFKIAAAQVASIRGDLAGNIETHAAAITSGAEQEVSVLVFPELSLVGYEPDLAAELAITATDDRLGVLAALARQHRMTVVAGAPLMIAGGKPALGAIVLAADGPPRSYAKMHLGGIEPTFFAPGNAPLALSVDGQKIGLAICADSSKPSHPQTYSERGCTVYAAGVFLNANWYTTDLPRLAGYASRLRMLVVMANHAASVGSYASVGRSAVWAPDGALLAEATGTESCLVIAGRTREGWRGEVVPV